MNRRRVRALPASLIVGLVMLGFMTMLALLAPIAWGSRADKLTANIRQGPSAHHWLGTDALGRDVLLRTLVASRLSLEMAGLATLIAVCVGALFGMCVGLANGRARAVGARTIDLSAAYPPIIIALAVTAILQPSRLSVVLAIGLAFFPQLARLTFTSTAAVVTKDFVTVARSMGLSRARLLGRHVLPNIAGPMLVLVSVGFATSIVALSGLSFLGIGVQPPAYDWGELLAVALRDIYTRPSQAYGPAIAILLAGLGAGLCGDGLNTLMRPRSATGRIRHQRRREPIPTLDAGMAVSADGDTAPELVLSVRNLWVGRRGTAAPDALVRGVSLDIASGETVGLVGESGSGKTLTAMALAQLLAPDLDGRVDRLTIAGNDAVAGSSAVSRRLATEIGVVFQDPSTCLNPALRIGTQLTEVSRVHLGIPKRQARRAAIERLTEVRVSEPHRRMRQLPHELSGGMRQRVMIAMALLSGPNLLIADEPTTALDVTVQADVLRLLKHVSSTRRMAILLISHDINVVSAVCDRVCVMYAGRIVEDVRVDDLRRGQVRHPYTKALLAASPSAYVRHAGPLETLSGRPPKAEEMPVGCAFAARCKDALPMCAHHDPNLELYGGGKVACHAVFLDVAEQDSWPQVASQTQ